MTNRLTFGLFVFASTLLAQNGLAPELNAKLQDLVARHRAWGLAINSFGASIELREASRTGDTIRYRIYATGLPHGATYTLVQWPVTALEPSVALEGISLNSDGLAVCSGKPGMCGDPNVPDDPIDLPLNPVEGEPYRLALVSSDKLRAATTFVPDPIAGTDKTCHVSAVLLMPHAEAVLIEGVGFPARAKLDLLVDSEGERHKWSKSSDDGGNFNHVVLPFVAGRQRGTMRMTVKSDTCSPVLALEWGGQ